MYVIYINGRNWKLECGTSLGQAHETVTTIHVKKSFLLGRGLMQTLLYCAVKSHWLIFMVTSIQN